MLVLVIIDTYGPPHLKDPGLYHMDQRKEAAQVNTCHSIA